MNTLLIATYLPFWRRDSGASQRLFTLQHQARRQGVLVHCYYTNPLTPADREQLEADRLLPQVHTTPRGALLRRKARRRLRKMAGWAHRPDDWREDRHALHRLILRLKPEFVLVEYTDFAPVLPELGPKPPRTTTLLDTVDIIYERRASFEAFGVAARETLSQEDELARMNRFDMLVAIQYEEQAELQRQFPDKKVLCAGYSQPVQPLPFRNTPPCRLLFVSGTGQHNVIALQRFLQEVWPAVRAELGEEVEFCVAGHQDALFPEGAPPEGVQPLGFVPLNAALYAEADIIVNPILAGSGLKIKNVEALSYGKPLVTTPIGAQGFPAESPPAFLTCTNAEETIKALCRLAKNTEERQSLSQRAAEYADRHFNETTAFGHLIRILSGAPR